MHLAPRHHRHALHGPRIVTADQIRGQHALIVSDGAIEAVVPLAELPADLERVDLGPGYLSAGLIDIHTHGAAGRSFNEADPEAFDVIGAALLGAGITSVLPTLASAPLPDLVTALEVLADLPSDTPRPRMSGAHLEGPYFSPEQAGAQDPQALRVPTDGSADQLLEHSDLIALLSLAPELDGAAELTARLVASGIVVAAGHSSGTANDLLACERAGLSHITHVFSGQSTTSRQGPWRVPGLLEATLASETLTVEMIGDGKHLPQLLMQLAYKSAGTRLALVSDSTAGAGLADGDHYRMGEVTYVVDNGVGMTMDRSSFGGSTTLLSQMIPTVMAALDLPLPDVLAMATAIPARAARLERVGSLTPGFHADLTLFDDQLRPRSVALAGVWQPASPPTATNQMEGHLL